VSHQYFIRAPTRKVFEAITESEWLTRWLCDRAAISPHKGGRYSIGWIDGPTHEGEVLEFVPGRSVTLAWSWEGVKLGGTQFKLSVEPKDDGALFEVEHSGFPREERWADLYGGAEWGWTYFAMNLKSVLETGYDLRSKYDG
jgi:uncharacterized protein YndB with AHSA1/START domain